MPQLKVQNFYSTALTSDIVGTGDTSFTVTVAPTFTSGFLVISPNNASLREIVYFHNVVGNTVSVRAENRGQGGTTAKAHTSSEPVAMKDIAEIFNMFSDSISQCFFVEKTGGLTIKVWGGTVFYNGNPVTVADTALTLADNQTNYIKYSYPTNTISVDAINSGNIKARVTTVSGAITSIQYYVAKESYIDFTVAITGALPSQSGNEGKALITDGANVGWGVCNLPRSSMLTAQNITATNGSPNINVTNTDGWFNGTTITGAGIPNGTTIVSFVANTNAVLSASFTGTTGTVSVIVGRLQLPEFDATGAEVKRIIGGGSSILSTDLVQYIDPVTRLRKEVAVSVLNASITSLAAPIGCIRDSTISGVFGAGYQLMQTQAMPNTDFFTNKTAMGTAREGASAGVIGTKMYVVGGDNGVSGAFTTNEEYDFTLNTWSTKAVLPGARSTSYHGVINGKFYIIGGTSDASVGTAYQPHTYEYDPVGNAWATKASLATSQGDGASGVYNGKLYIIGGINNAGTTLNTVQYYDPVGNAFTTGLTVMPNARRRCHNHGVTIGSKIYVAGGTDSGGTAQTSMYEYDVIANTWATKTVMPGAIFVGHMEVGTVDGEARVISVSGFNGSVNVGNVYEFSPTGNSWASRSTAAPQRRAGAVVSYLNEIYYAGGYTSTTVASLDKYTLYKNRYTYERIS